MRKPTHHKEAILKSQFRNAHLATHGNQEYRRIRRSIKRTTTKLLRTKSKELTRELIENID